MWPLNGKQTAQGRETPVANPWQKLITLPTAASNFSSKKILKIWNKRCSNDKISSKCTDKNSVTKNGYIQDKGSRNDPQTPSTGTGVDDHSPAKTILKSLSKQGINHYFLL